MSSLADYRIKVEQQAYERTKNPLHAWEAYAIARRSQRAIPEWVLQYMDKAQRGLVYDLPDAIEARGNKKNLGPVIARLFGFATVGAGSPVNHDPKWLERGRTVRQLITRGIEGQEKGGALTVYHAKQTAAEIHGVNFSTIGRAWEVYETVLPNGEDEPIIDEDDLPEPDDEDRSPLVPMDD